MQGRIVEGPNQCTEPGDYTLPMKGYTGEVESSFFLLPNARDENAEPEERSVQHVSFPPHTYVIEEDGTLTISPSILSHTGWHGYLEKGIWRTV